MNDEKKYQITLPEGTKELSILEGQHRHEEITKKKVDISGTITAPGLYVDHLRVNDKLQTFDPVVTVDMEALTILYDGNPRDTYGEKVKGKLEYEPSTLAIGINTDKRWTVDGFKNFVRLNRNLFPNSVQHGELLNSIAGFKLKLQREIEMRNDNRGNKTEINNSILETEMPFHFNLLLPIFKGGEKVEIRVDVCLEVVGSSGVQFWFDSVEYKEAIETQRDEIMTEQIKKFQGLNVIFI